MRKSEITFVLYIGGNCESGNEKVLGGKAVGEQLECQRIIVVINIYYSYIY